jgi:protein MpaA
VDLNRNCPTQDWVPMFSQPRYFPGSKPGSEPENKILLEFVARLSPQLIVSAHSWEPMVNYTGDCLAAAEALGRQTGYRLSPDIGYPTPGSFGTWAAKEHSFPTITLEIQEKLPLQEVWTLHGPALAACFRAAVGI